MIKQTKIWISRFCLVVLVLCGCQPKPAKVFFKNVEDGARLSSPIRVEMGVEGMKIEPAGTVRAGYGHHHILVNQTHIPKGEIIPQNDTTFHYGKGQETAELQLLPGKYTLSLQLGDGVHTSYGKALSASVEVYVEE